MKDDIDKAMECSEATLSLCLGFSKAFGTIHFNVRMQKIHKLHFCKTFLPLFLLFIKPNQLCTY